MKLSEKVEKTQEDKETIKIFNKVLSRNQETTPLLVILSKNIKRRVVSSCLSASKMLEMSHC